jgi:hypothetical protein
MNQGSSIACTRKTLREVRSLCMVNDGKPPLHCAATAATHAYAAPPEFMAITRSRVMASSSPSSKNECMLYLSSKPIIS